MFETAGDLVTFALKAGGIVGVGQTPAAEESNDGLTLLNLIMAQWGQRRWIVPALVETIVPCTGAVSYSVGPGGDVPMTRPSNVQDAFVRLLNQGTLTFDYPMRVLGSREDYNKIAIKNLPSFPGAVYYSPSIPLGQLFVSPVPNNAYELHIFTKSLLPALPTLTTPLAVPPEYEEALYANLACAMRPFFGKQPDPTLIAQMRAAMNTVRSANLQVPTMSMPSPLQGRSGQTTLGQLMGGVW